MRLLGTIKNDIVAGTAPPQNLRWCKAPVRWRKIFRTSEELPRRGRVLGFSTRLVVKRTGLPKGAEPVAQLQTTTALFHVFVGKAGRRPIDARSDRRARPIAVPLPSVPPHPALLFLSGA